MKPTEKAIELIESFACNQAILNLEDENLLEQSKSQSLICINEILKYHDSLLNLGLKNVHMTLESPVKQYNDVLNPIRKYWEEVKQEIEKL